MRAKEQGGVNPSGELRGPVVLIGPHGAGKSTQAKLLAARFEVPNIGQGRLVGLAADFDCTLIGAACAQARANHVYPGLPVISQLIRRRLAQGDIQNRFVLEGALRTVSEVKWLPEAFEEAGIDNAAVTVFSLELPIKEADQRMRSRGRIIDTEADIQLRQRQYLDKLEERMSLIRQQWRVEPIMVFGKDKNTVHEEILTRLAQ